MRKEDLISDILYIAMAAIVLLVGFLVIQPAINNGLLGQEIGANIAFVIIALIVGIVLNVLIMEIGHLFGALIGKYKVLSVNFLGLNFYKDFSQNNAKPQLKFRFKAFNGLTGETLIEPKSDKSSPVFYVLLPFIFYLLEFAIMYFVVLIVSPTSETYFELPQIMKYGLIISTTIAGCIVLYDYFPAKLDTMNDGYRLISLKNKINIEAFNEQLKLEANEYKGIKNVEYKIFDEITDFTAKVNLQTALKKVDEGEKEEALEIINKCISDTTKVSHSTLITLTLTKIFLVYLLKGIQEGNNEYKALDEDTKNIVKKCKSIEAIRVYTLYVGLNEKSKSEVKYAINKAKKYYEKLTIGEVEKEIKLIAIVIKQLIDLDPQLVDDDVLKDACNGNVNDSIYKELVKYKQEKEQK